MKILNIIILILLLSSCKITKKSNNDNLNNYKFEGWVKYKTTPMKPDYISDEIWETQIRELYGNQGYILYQNFHKPNKYRGEISTGNEVGLEIYNPKDSLYYAWEKNSKKAFTSKSESSSPIKIKEIVYLENIDTINNIPCNLAEVQLNIGKYTVWYNSEYLKFESNNYKGTLFSEKLVNELKCLPIKMEIKGLMIVEFLEYNLEKIEDDKFLIPEFDEIIKKN